MLWSILHRMILGELVKVFLLTLTAITALLLLAGVVKEAAQQGIGFAQLLIVIPLLIPSTLPFTVPAATLFAACLVYGRLAHDNEVLAIKSAGINVLRIIWPGILLGIVMSTATLAMYYYLIPTSLGLLRTTAILDAEDFLYAMLNRDGCIRHPKLPYEIYVKRVQGRKLFDAEFKRKDDKGHYDIVAKAGQAELQVNLAKGELEIRMQNVWVTGEGGNSTNGRFEEKIFPVPLPKDFVDDRGKKAREMSWQEILQRLDELQTQREHLDTEIALTTAKVALSEAPRRLPEHLDNLRNQRKEVDNITRLMHIELHMRPSLALSCIFFVLIGCPVGIWFSRSDYLSAFITCFVPILFLYYPLLLCGHNMAKSGRVPPAAGLWMANAVIAVAALPLYRRLLKY